MALVPEVYLGGKGDMMLRVKGWDSFQHYKHRAPPWIKLHRALLEDHAIAVLPDQVKAHLIGIWLLAASADGQIPDDAEFVARRINATVPVDLQTLIRLGFLTAVHDASTSLAGCKQSAPLVEESRVEQSRAEQSRLARRVNGSESPQEPLPQPSAGMASPVNRTDPGAGLRPRLRVVMAANLGLEANPAMRGEAQIRPLTPERAGVVDTWLADGIPQETIERVVREVAERYQPTKLNPRVGSLRYFDRAVREAHASGPAGESDEDRITRLFA